MKKLGLCLLVGLALMAVPAYSQTFNTTGTTSVSVTVAAEASIAVTTATTSLTNTGTIFNDYTGTTNLDYKIRTTKTGGTGTITLKVTADFAGSGGPSVGTPPSSGDALTYTCTVSSPGTACTGPLTSSTSASTNVATFGADAHSVKAGNTGSVAWTLTNDPVYQTGTYSATVTFTISAA
jgi:hypothetical protein